MVQTLWFATAKYLLLTQAMPAYERQVVDLVAMAQELITRQAVRGGASDLSADEVPEFETLKVLPDSAARPKLVRHRLDDFPGDLSEALQRRFGPNALSLREEDADVSWLRFPVEGELYWLTLPMSPTRSVSYARGLFIFLQIGLAVAGAYLIVFRLRKKLGYVTDAARAIGQGKPPKIMDTSGPDEIRALCEGFNQMSRDLIKLEADRRLMLAGISHDLRTPLTRLRIVAEMADCEMEQSMVNDIEDMEAILKQFLDYARDGSEEKLEICDLNQVVRETEQRFKSKGCDIRLQLGELSSFPFRRNSIRRVLDNLVDNATRYGKTEVCIESGTNAGFAYINVRDRGPGIRDGEPSDFTKPFAREDSSRSVRGAGLGLAIVERVARSHGGTFQLVNLPEGGLSARLDLPLSQSVSK